jgi:hypothetical protein
MFFFFERGSLVYIKTRSESRYIPVREYEVPSLAAAQISGGSYRLHIKAAN